MNNRWNQSVNPLEQNEDYGISIRAAVRLFVHIAIEWRKPLSTTLITPHDHNTYYAYVSLLLNKRGRLLCFNLMLGKSSVVDDVIGMLGEETCNASGSELISFLNEVELNVCNGRNLVVELE